MNKSLCFSIFVTVFLSSCSSSEPACEEITLASEQIQECQALHKRLINARNNKGGVIVRTELERRYQQDCIDSRYYRDEKQSAICGNKHKLNEIRKSAKTEVQAQQ